MTTPQLPGKPEVTTRTTFNQSESDKQWYWQTKAINNEIVADGSEGYKTLKNAMKGFFVSQGVEYVPFGSWPTGYGPLTRIDEQNYQISKYLDTNTENN